MKKRITTLFVFLLIACLMLTACSTGESFEPEVEPTEELEMDPDFVEMNCYDVGGVTFRLETHIEDYITDEKEFRFNDLAADLGWYTRPIGGKINPAKVEKTYDLEDSEYNPFIGFDLLWYTDVGNINFGTIPKEKLEKTFGAHLLFFVRFEKTGENDPDQTDIYNPGPDMYYLYLRAEPEREEKPHLIHFSEIVIVTYIMENYMYDMGEDFFDEMFERTGTSGWTVHE